MLVPVPDLRNANTPGNTTRRYSVPRVGNCHTVARSVRGSHPVAARLSASSHATYVLLLPVRVFAGGGGARGDRPGEPGRDGLPNVGLGRDDRAPPSVDRAPARWTARAVTHI